MAAQKPWSPTNVCVRHAKKYRKLVERSAKSQAPRVDGRPSGGSIPGRLGRAAVVGKRWGCIVEFNEGHSKIIQAFNNGVNAAGHKQIARPINFKFVNVTALVADLEKSAAAWFRRRIGRTRRK